GADGVDATVEPFADALVARMQSAAARQSAIAAHADAIGQLVDKGEFQVARVSVAAFLAAANSEALTAADRAWVSSLANAQAARLAQAEAARDERNRVVAIVGGAGALLSVLLAAVVVVQIVAGRRKAA
ncbi:MAG: hypothetical protein ACKOGJ_00915, partial [Phycisphaerales bacterium]